MGRRLAIAAAATALALAAPGCRFSGGDNADDSQATSTTSAELVALGDEETSTTVETTTTTAATATTVRRVATTARPSVQAAPRTTARPAPPPASPHCNASAADTFYGNSWTVNVSSTFPSTPVTIDLKWAGGSGNYSGYTDPAGSWSKTQRVQPSMRGQRVSVTVTVGNVRCSTSFAAS